MERDRYGRILRDGVPHGDIGVLCGVHGELSLGKVRDVPEREHAVVPLDLQGGTHADAPAVRIEHVPEVQVLQVRAVADERQAQVRCDRVAACGRCDACQLRRKGFDEAGSADPLEYATE